MNSFDNKQLQSKGFDPRISLVEGQCSNHYTIKASVITTIFKWTLNGQFFASLLFVEFTEFSEYIESTS